MSTITNVEINTTKTRTSSSSIAVECNFKEDNKTETVIKSFEIEVFNNGVKVNNLELIDTHKAKIEDALLDTNNYTILNIEPTSIGAVLCDRYMIFNSEFNANESTYALTSEKIYFCQPLYK